MPSDPNARSDDSATADPPPLCGHCGYSLAGVPDLGRCPECGQTVAQTLRGRPLRHADPRWRRGVCAGARLVALASAIAPLCLVVLLATIAASLLLKLGGNDWLWTYGLGPGFLVAAAMLWRGWWLMTRPEPDAPLAAPGEPGSSALRITLVAGVLVVAAHTIALAVLDAAGRADAAMVVSSALIVPLGLLWIIHLFAAMRLFASLAARMPDAKRAREFNRWAWKLGVALACYGVLLATGVLDRQGRAIAIAGLPTIIQLAISLAILLVSLLTMASPFIYGFAALWVWRRLREIEMRTAAADRAANAGSAPP